MKRFVVYRKNAAGNLRELDAVYMADNLSAEEVRSGLINHDGYPRDIVVVRVDGKGIVLEKAEGSYALGLGLG